MLYIKSLLVTTTALVAWTLVVGYVALNGWGRNPIATPGDSRSFAHAAIEIIKKENRGNVAFLLIEGGKTFEEFYIGNETPDEDTIFATASMSKWITAWGVMKLVQDRKIDLDAPVSTYLTRWQLPETEFDNEGVTVRRLLSHMSGLNDGLGFADYGADEVVPPLTRTLSGPRASSGNPVKIAVGVEPGSEFQYSGGGYLILQLLIEEVSGETFQDYMWQSLFRPLGMTRSTYQYLGEVENVSKSYDEQGQIAPLYQYAASGATGFATTLADMGKFIRAQLKINAMPNPLNQESIKSMRQTHASVYGKDIWGLGTILYAATANGDLVYGHDGRNEPAINSTVRINSDNGDAIAVLVSGRKSLATNLGFEWVFWQTGLPGVLGTGRVIREATKPFFAGCVLILFLAVATTWWLRRRVWR